MNQDSLLRNLSCPTDRQIEVADQTFLFFGGTAYLGLLNQADFRDLHIAGMLRYGINNGTSRNNNVQLGIYPEAEAYMAQRYGVEEAILLSSGYLAAQLCIKFLAKKGTVYYAPGAHPALWLADNPGVQGDFNSWAKDCILAINASTDTDIVIVSNSLDNMRPEQYNFSLFEALDPSKRVYFLIDDSHGINVLREGKFSFENTTFQRANCSVITIASLAKGMGVDAGGIFGPAELLSEMRRHPIFTGASPASPGSMYALVQGADIYAKAHASLQHNIELMQQDLPKDCLHMPHFPVYTFEDAGLFDYLRDAGILVSSFPYPLATDPLLNRVVINAQHRAEDIKLVQAALKAYFSTKAAL